MLEVELLGFGWADALTIVAAFSNAALTVRPSRKLLHFHFLPVKLMRMIIVPRIVGDQTEFGDIHARRGAADCGEYRQAAGASALKPYCGELLHQS